MYLLLLYLALYNACSNDQECLTTFCEGPQRCNSLSQQCEPIQKSDPCAMQREAVNLFTSKTGYEMSIQCVNELRACVELYYCVRDTDCDDRRYCNGVERCVEGHCQRALDLTHLCEACDEETRCGVLTGSALKTLQSEGTAPASATSIYTLVVIVAIVGTLVVLGLLILICSAASGKKFI